MYYFPDASYVYASFMSKFFTVEDINDNLNDLAINYIKIRDEFKSVKDKLVYIESSGVYTGCKYAPLYQRYHPTMDKKLSDLEIKYDQKVYLDPDRDIIYTENAKKLPILFDTCYHSGLRQRVDINVLPPEHIIDWHVDSDSEYEDDMIIRGLWGIDINPQNRELCHIYLNSKTDGLVHQNIINNGFNFFWGRTPHHVHNTLTMPRVCLSFDNIVSLENLL